MQKLQIRVRAGAAFALATTLAGQAHALATSAPQAEYRPAAIAEKVQEALSTPDGSGRRIVLSAPSDSERAQLQRRSAAAAVATASKSAPAPKRTPRDPLRIGYPRAVPGGERAIALDTLEWQSLPGGAQAARIEVSSAGAQGLRLAIAMSPGSEGLSLRFRGNGHGAKVMRAVSAQTVATTVARDGHYWTPVLEGDVAAIELVVPAGSAPAAGASLTVEKVSHLVVAGRSLERIDPKRVADIGDAAACNIDFACVTPSPALAQVANSVGKIVASDANGFTILCTGTLMNDTASTFTPYVFTANHCMDTEFRASTVNVYWFFRAQSCNSLAVPNYVLQEGGARLLARSEDYDWSLIELNRQPPTGVYFAAWRAEPVPQLAVGTALHHPQGDLLQFTQGTTPGYEFFDDGSSFLIMQWSQGTTETGSSGSALFTFLSQANTYELRGGLFGGDHACSNPEGVDLYSRLDNMLPLVREYLTPNESNSGGLAVAVEYYNASLDHYFITAFANEIDVLDRGTLPGWQRTGIRFLVYTSPTPGTNPVCRYYLRPAVGDSHFYSGDAKECVEVATRFGASWALESLNVFYIALPDPSTSACPAGMRPLWRFYNSQRINHRYTPEVLIRDALRSDPRWTPEGYGPDAVIMCSPIGS